MSRTTATLLVILAISTAAFSQTSFRPVSAASGDIVRPRMAVERSTTGLVSASVAEQQAFILINRQRGIAGLAPLDWSDDLAEVARSHSRSMAENGFFSHRGLDGTTVDARAERFGITEWTSIGENIAFSRGYEDVANFTVGRWMRSDSHRMNLLDKRWTETGVGVEVLPDGTYFFTQVFILRR